MAPAGECLHSESRASERPSQKYTAFSRQIFEPTIRQSIADRLAVGPPHHDRRRSRRFARDRPVAGRVLDVDEEGREVGRIGQTRDLAAERPDEKAFRLLVLLIDIEPRIRSEEPTLNSSY